MAIGAVIMAGGEGVRLRPMTLDRPKPLMPLLGKPVMAYALDLLERHGVQEAAVTLCYRAEDVKKAFAKRGGVRLYWCAETTPLGTAGSVKLAASCAKDTFFVLSGDGLTDADLSAALSFHQKNGALATLVLKRERAPLPYGVVMTDENGRVTEFIEKPSWPRVHSDLVNTGIYILEKELLKDIPDAGRPDFGRDIFPALLKSGAPLYGFETADYWRDIGSQAAFLDAQSDLLFGRVSLPRPPRISPKAQIDPDARVDEFSYVLAGARVEKGARIERSVVGEGARVAQRAEVTGSCLMRRASVFQGARVEQSVLCEGARAEKGAYVMPGGALGTGAVAARGARVLPNVRVWPYMTAAEGALIERDVLRADAPALRAAEGALYVSSPADAARLGAALAGQEGRWLLVGRRGEPLLHVLAGALFGCGARARVAFGERVFAPALGASENAPSVFIAENALYFYDALGFPYPEKACRALADAALKALLPPFSPGLGRISFDLNAVDEYLSILPARRESGAPLHVTSADRALRALISRAFSPAMPGAPTLLLLDGGASYALSHRGRRFPKETTAALCASLLKREGALYAEAELPRAARERFSARPYGRDERSKRHYAAFHDGFAFGRLLSDALCEQSLDALLNALPTVAVSRRAVPCAAGQKSRVLALLSALPGEKTRGEGLLFRDERGDVTILPDGARNLVRVTAEAARYEIADELCARYAALAREKGRAPQTKEPAYP